LLRLSFGDFCLGEVAQRSAGAVLGEEVFSGDTTRHLSSMAALPHNGEAGGAVVLQLRNVDVMRTVGSLADLVISWRINSLITVNEALSPYA
jgi:hypothetical protein